MPTVSSAHLMCMSTHHLDGLEQLISIDELSDYLGVPVRTIYDWRLSGHGRCAIRVGRHLKYAVSDVREWLAGQRESTPGRTASGT
jgi:excisionase family DNA binding protein